MEKLTDDDIHNIANLAQLKVSDEEVGQFRGDLENVLNYFQKLTELETEGIEEIGHITGMTDVFRTDRAKETSPQEREDIMSQVPASEGGAIAVKNVL